MRCCGGEIGEGRICSCGEGGEVRKQVPSDASIFTMDAIVRGLNGADWAKADRVREAADLVGEVTDPEARRALYAVLGLVSR